LGSVRGGSSVRPASGGPCVCVRVFALYLL
jgi:hypothetical protein